MEIYFSVIATSKKRSLALSFIQSVVKLLSFIRVVNVSVRDRCRQCANICVANVVEM